ncbi:hypothetical protein CSA37_04635 [Candidatus Fermentibacteria bacterium]|nr:MAG: hypothetical protein CSA37_06985 [Candidatus Fermentibacteria bacterium]PIE52935.1 MAG: hypothetical protein CSA37_04635 [Candidatus Fermentibacteria bacterium]
MFITGCSVQVSRDRWNHFAFSAAAASTAAAAVADPGKAMALSAGTGLLKEIYDGLYGSGFSTCDLVWDMAGVLAGGVAAHTILIMEDDS